VIVPQPKVELASLLMAPDIDDPARERYEELLRKPPTTYIGSVPFGPTLDDHPSKEPKLSAPKSPRPLLFAQSSNSYPLINFAHAPRPGSLINGSFPLTDVDSINEVPEDEHHITQYLIDPPREEASTIDPPTQSLPIGASGMVFKWWWLVAIEVVAVFWLGIGIYRWAFTKATALANSGAKSAETTALLSATSNEKGATTPVVRFEALPDTGPATPAEGTTPPKKKSTRRRVRGKKKRRNSVGPQLDRDDDDGDDDEEDKGEVTADERPNGSGVPNGNSNGNASTHSSSNGSTFFMVEKPLPAIPRTLSTPALQDEQERLAISDTVIGYGSHGTVVLKGTWGGRPVAVKRLLSDFVRLASQEVKLLQASDDHPNVIRCEFNR
jgi:serine/threonine-protein kinase/endoribonuclease IRE1